MLDTNSLYLQRLVKEQSDNIRTLNNQIETLEMTLDNYKSEMKILQKYQSIVNDNQVKLDVLEKSKKEVDEELSKLKRSSYVTELNLNKKIRDERIDYTRIINDLKDEVAKLKQGYDNINKLQFYITTLENLNGELHDQVKKLDSNFKEDIAIEKEKLNMKVDVIRKNTLETMAKSKIIVNENAFKNLTTSTKLQMIQITQLYEELNTQSKLVEEILIDKAKKERLITNLQIDIKVHEEVESSLSKQNQKLTKILKEIDFRKTKFDPNQNIN